MADTEYDYGADDYVPDELEEAMGNCHQFCGDDGYIYCGAVGSEDCEFECPFNVDIGKRWRRGNHG